MRKETCVLIVAAALSACATTPSATSTSSAGGPWVMVGDASAHHRASNQVASDQPPKQVFWFLAGR